MDFSTTVLLNQFIYTDRYDVIAIIERADRDGGWVTASMGTVGMGRFLILKVIMTNLFDEDDGGRPEIANAIMSPECCVWE